MSAEHRANELGKYQAEFRCPLCHESVTVVEHDAIVPEHKYEVPIATAQGREVECLPDYVIVLCPASGADLIWRMTGHPPGNITIMKL